tara:strand:- start:147 stop:329 length:183 start_codon:yes stop_codon:yes gene_type:complete
MERKKYIVTTLATYAQEYVVEAVDEGEAIDLVAGGHGETEGAPEFIGSEDTDEWSARRAQ